MARDRWWHTICSVFMSFLSMDPHICIGTAIVTELFGKTSGTLSYIRQRPILYNLLPPFILIGFPGVVLGSYLSFAIESNILKFLFGLTTITLAIIVLRSVRRGDRGHKERVEIKELRPHLWVPFLAGSPLGCSP